MKGLDTCQYVVGQATWYAINYLKTPYQLYERKIGDWATAKLRIL